MKIGRDAFLYMAPRGPNHSKFAQCETCREFMPGKGRCAVMDVPVKPGWSCGLYFYGTPSDDHQAQKSVTPEEAGLVKSQVRCENCASFAGPRRCRLYEKINNALPELFALDERVEAKGCCDAWNPKARHAYGGQVNDPVDLARLEARKRLAMVSA